MYAGHAQSFRISRVTPSSPSNQVHHVVGISPTEVHLHPMNVLLPRMFSYSRSGLTKKVLAADADVTLPERREISTGEDTILQPCVFVLVPSVQSPARNRSHHPQIV